MFSAQVEVEKNGETLEVMRALRFYSDSLSEEGSSQGIGETLEVMSVLRFLQWFFE